MMMQSAAIKFIHGPHITVQYSKEAEEENKAPQAVTYEAYQPVEVKVDKSKVSDC